LTVICDFIGFTLYLKIPAKQGFLQHAEPKPRDFLKVLQSSTFKKSLVVRLLGNCYKLV